MFYRIYCMFCNKSVILLLLFDGFKIIFDAFVQVFVSFKNIFSSQLCHLTLIFGCIRFTDGFYALDDLIVWKSSSFTTIRNNLGLFLYFRAKQSGKCKRFYFKLEKVVKTNKLMIRHRIVFMFSPGSKLLLLVRLNFFMFFNVIEKIKAVKQSFAFYLNKHKNSTNLNKNLKSKPLPFLLLFCI